MNCVTLVGRLTRDPELRYTAGTQMPVASFTLAVDRNVSRANADPSTPTADFIRIVVFGKQAENCSTYLSKGREAAVQGRIQTGSYTKQDGTKVYTTDVVADRVEFIGGRSNNQGSGGYQNQAAYQGGPQNQGGYSEPAGGPEDAIPEGFHAFDDDDDVPF
ncbi:MAG: single-stranded DNA-binding protein [Firmicutes bacterium]|nr:single-stranded DNA-binding protein [Bacillota bacterium]